MPNLTAIKRLGRGLVPLTLRKRLAVWINSRPWLPLNARSWWAQELIRDMSVEDANAFHKFLWAHHLGYAESYEAAGRFGEENMEESRKLFFAELRGNLLKMGVDPATDVRSVFEVGCSLGYQLRYAETGLFPAADRFDGIDIDRYAIDSGTAYLRSIGSKVHLMCGDMEGLEEFLRDRTYDIVMCSGVLMYLEKDAAARVVERILRHARMLAAFTGLAAPGCDNSLLQESQVRHRDHTFVHNIDSMVDAANGRVIARRWDGERMVGGQTIYFVFAVPPQPHSQITSRPVSG